MKVYVVVNTTNGKVLKVYDSGVKADRFVRSLGDMRVSVRIESREVE